MINVNRYIKLILKKRKLTFADLIEIINKIEEKNNISSKTYLTHLTTDFTRERMSLCKARKIEIALDLNKYELVGMITSVDRISKESMKSLQEIDDKYKK